MKNILIFLALAFLLAHCTTLEFEQPLPNEGQEMKTLPRSLVGTYQNFKDSSSLAKEYQRIEFIPKDAAWELRTQVFVMVADLDTSREAFVRNDSLFSVESDTSVPTFALLVKRMGDRYVAAPKLRYHMEPSKGKFVQYNEDTGAPTPHTLILRKQGDTYFFNIQGIGAKYWQTTTLQQTPQGIRFQYLSAPLGEKLELPFATRLVVNVSPEGNSDTSRVAMPTDLELAKYRTNLQVVNTEELLRVEPQK